MGRADPLVLGGQPLVAADPELPVPDLGQAADGLRCLVASDAPEVVAGRLELRRYDPTDHLLIERLARERSLQFLFQLGVAPHRDRLDEVHIVADLLRHERSDVGLAEDGPDVQAQSCPEGVDDALAMVAPHPV